MTESPSAAFSLMLQSHTASGPAGSQVDPHSGTAVPQRAEPAASIVPGVPRSAVAAEP